MKPEVFVTPPAAAIKARADAEVEEIWDSFGDDSSPTESDVEQDLTDTALCHVSESDFAVSSSPAPEQREKSHQIDFSAFVASGKNRTPELEGSRSSLEAAPAGATVIEPEVLPRAARGPSMEVAAVARGRETPVPGLRLLPFTIRSKGPWQSVFLLSAPIFLALLALTTVFAGTRMNPERFGKMVLSIVPDVFGPRGPKIPPSSLLIKRGEMVKISLLDGDGVPLIFGRVLNAGNTPVGGVLVEAAILDGEGRLLASKRVKAGNELSRESRDGISREVALRLESATRSKRNRIEPGESSDFAMIFDELPASAEPRYFSTRVYSVE